MKILLVASVIETVQSTLNYLEKNWEKKGFAEYQKGEATIFILITGYAPVFMPYALLQFHEIKNIDTAIYGGLAAAETRVLDVGQTVNVGRDIFGDIGIQESDGKLYDMFDLKYHEKNKFPFFKGELFNEDIINPLKHQVVKGISLNTIPGTYESIEALNQKYHAEIITTNGAAFAYTCKMLDIKYYQMRTIYRHLELTTIRNREKDFAIENLNIELLKLIDHLSYQKKSNL